MALWHGMKKEVELHKERKLLKFFQQGSVPAPFLSVSSSLIKWSERLYSSAVWIPSYLPQAALSDRVIWLGPNSETVTEEISSPQVFFRATENLHSHPWKLLFFHNFFLHCLIHGYESMICKGSLWHTSPPIPWPFFNDFDIFPWVIRKNKYSLC